MAPVELIENLLKNLYVAGSKWCAKFEWKRRVIQNPGEYVKSE